MKTTQYHPKSADAYRLLHDGVLALANAEAQGMRIDMQYCQSTEIQLTKKIELLESNFRKSAFFKKWQQSSKTTVNINSGSQLGAYLYKVLKITPAKTTKSGGGATDEDALRALNLPELNDLLAIRKLKKVRDTYLLAFVREQVDGYIHPFYNLHTVKTFRSSSDRPNFQNIPKRDKEAMKLCRRAIYPRPGHQLMEIDYGALEVRIAACYHKDPTMMAYINDPTSDMHGDMAREIFMMPDFDKNIPQHATLRSATKNGFVFPQFYGDYYKNCAIGLANAWGKLPEGKWKKGQGIEAYPGVPLADHLISKGIKSMDDFIQHLKKIEDNFWNVRFPVYKKWKESQWAAYQKNGYVELYTGFRCYGVMEKNDAINYPVQGAAFHCLLWSFIEMDRIIIKEGLDTKLLGQIHDAIILDVAPNELEYVADLIHRITCVDLPKYWKWINVPLEIEAELAPVDTSWAELQKYKLKPVA